MAGTQGRMGGLATRFAVCRPAEILTTAVTTSVASAQDETALGSRPRVLRLGVIGLSTLVGALLLATGIATSAAAAGPKDIAWKGCGEQLECAKVRVPLDWDHPRGSKIKLAVIRHLASRPDERIGSMFVNPGGPGGSVEQVRGDGADLDAAGQGRFDVVGWDIRGAGESTQVRCFRSEQSRTRFFGDWSIPTPGLQSSRIRGKAAALARRCGEVSGGLLRHISSADTARDLDYLRRLVGDRKLTYMGISAGTFIGQTYANMFPRRVRALVLDGVVDPVAYTRGTEAGYANQLGYSDRGFEGFLSLCESAGPGRCALAGAGPVAARFDQLLADLRRGSIPAPTADPPGALTYGDAVSAIIVSMSGGPAAWPELAAQLDQAARGDGSALATAGRLLTTVFSSQDAAPGLPAVALICADSPARQGPGAWRSVLDRLTGVSFIYGPVITWWRWAPCASWPAASADRYTGPWNASTRNPVLVIGTRFDPNTPYANARRAARRFGNAVLLTHDGYSHTSPKDPSACVKSATSEYLVNLVTPPQGTICPSDRLPFDPDFGEPIP
jgi:pimeloyl-ACP methyl ester carboxylesterase